MTSHSEQRSEEWHSQRLGRVTASQVTKVMSKGKGATRDSYMIQLISERLTGIPTSIPTTPDMQWGIDNEDDARAAYERETGIFVDETGFHTHDSIERFGASPDGLAEDGLLEIKCMKTANHIDFLEKGTIKKVYRDQMIAQIACTGRGWCDFVSYDPRLPSELQLKIVRFQPDKEVIKEMEDAVVAFIKEMEERINKLFK